MTALPPMNGARAGERTHTGLSPERIVSRSHSNVMDQAVGCGTLTDTMVWTLKDISFAANEIVWLSGCGLFVYAFRNSEPFSQGIGLIPSRRGPDSATCSQLESRTILRRHANPIGH